MTPRLEHTCDGRSQGVDVTGQLRLARQIDVGQTYLKPRLGPAVSHIGFSGFEESGGPGALSVRGMDDTVFSAPPALEWGAEFALAGGRVAALCDGSRHRPVGR